MPLIARALVAGLAVGALIAIPTYAVATFMESEVGRTIIVFIIGMLL